MSGIQLQSPDSSEFGRFRNGFLQTVTTKIPVVDANSEVPMFARSDEWGEYWPCMIEKAVAASLAKVWLCLNMAILFPAMFLVIFGLITNSLFFL